MTRSTAGDGPSSRGSSSGPADTFPSADRAWRGSGVAGTRPGAQAGMERPQHVPGNGAATGAASEGWSLRSSIDAPRTAPSAGHMDSDLL